MKKIICLLILGLMPVCAHAQEATPEPESPWILAPTVSSDPKLGTSLGLVGGYLYSFDAGSTQSMFMAGGNYSDNESRVLGVFGQMFFDSAPQWARDTEIVDIFWLLSILALQDAPRWTFVFGQTDCPQGASFV